MDLSLLPHWATRFKYACLLQSNGKGEEKEWELAVSNTDHLHITSSEEQPFEQLKTLCNTSHNGLYGFLSYDLKNAVEKKLSSNNPDRIGMPLLHFFEPEILIKIQGQNIEIISQKWTKEKVLKSIQNTSKKSNPPFVKKIQARETETAYKETIAKIRQHIIEGDIYEMNYCTEFFVETADISPAALFLELNQIALAPFSVFYKCDDKYLICGSPERFIKKQGNRISSQPIKGTAPRHIDSVQDQIYKEQLRKSIKDQAENVMIVDLVRNDFAKSCKAGTVKVDELFAIYGFEQVWHMISTISGELREDVHFVDAIKAAFPMGSMTGAPKVMAMELIEKYEKTQRGLYSGAVGYISSEGNFDFNVVIRSILYNAAKSYLSFQVGGAIVYDSIPEQEYQECLLKAKSMRKAVVN